MNKTLVILLVGRIITNFADSLYMVATVWYVKTLTHSALLVGLTSAIAFLPITLQFLFGPIIDRFSKRKILTYAIIGQGVIVSLLSFLFFSKLLWLPMLYLLMFIALTMSEATYPTESAMIESLTTREKLAKVNSIFSFTYTTLDIICDAISGILIMFLGIGWIYLSNGLLLICTGLLFLFYLSIPKSKKERRPSEVSFIRQYKRDFIDGFHIVRNQKLLLRILFGVICMNVMATMGLAMLPIISKSSGEYGFWLTAMSIGSLLGTLISSKLKSFPLNRVLPAVAFFSGMCWLLSFLTESILLIPYLFFCLAWLGIAILGIFIQTLIQINVPSDYLGIGFAFISSLLGSLSPLGYFFGGFLGEMTTSSIMMVMPCIGYFAFTFYFLLDQKLRRLSNRLSDQLDKA